MSGPDGRDSGRRDPGSDPIASGPRGHAAGGGIPAVVTVQVDGGCAGQRIDNFLLARLKGVPKSHLYRVLRRGEVRVNKGRVKADYRLQSGDLVRIPPVRTPQPRAPGRTPDGQLARLAQAVLYEDDRLLVIDKPSGLAVHGGSGLSYGLIESLRQLRPGVELELVHRLDRDTSGCILVSKRRSTLRNLHAMLRDGGGEDGVEKRYLALILGELPRAELWVDAPLAKAGQPGGERLVRVDRSEGKAARTLFRRIRRLSFEAGTATLVEARLLTGRTHQIRVHAAHLGTPLAGDPKYGDFEANRRLKSLGLGRLFLHAWRLSFRADYMPTPLQVESPLPPDLTGVLDRLAPARSERAGPHQSQAEGE